MSKQSNNLNKYDFLDSIEGVPPHSDLQKQNIIHHIKGLAPGVMACLMVSLAATFISNHYGAPVMLISLLLGISFHFMSQENPTKAGVQYTSRSILKAGVILIGGRIVFSDLATLGIETIILVISATIAVIFLSVLCAKILKIDKDLGLLIGGATAICGASAAIALSAIMPYSKNLEKNTLVAVVGVTTIGTILMIVYPIAIGFIGFNNEEAGILIGGTIHDVSQVVGAGYSISEKAGDTAILVKLVRIFMLLPIILVFIYLNKKEKNTTNRSVFPLFIFGFMALVILNSLHLIPPEITALLASLSKWFLVMAITAVGMKTSLKELSQLGWKPIILIAADTFIICVIYLTVIMFNII